MQLSQPSKKTRAYDSTLVPMINVVFLLLIFFMMAGTFKQMEPVDVETPKSVRNQSITHDRTILLSAQGIAYVDGRSRTLEELPVVLKSLGWTGSQSVVVPPVGTQGPTGEKLQPSQNRFVQDAEQPEEEPGQPGLVVKADANVSIAEFRAFISALRHSGISRVELLTSATALTPPAVVEP